MKYGEFYNELEKLCKEADEIRIKEFCKANDVTMVDCNFSSRGGLINAWKELHYKEIYFGLISKNYAVTDKIRSFEVGLNNIDEYKDMDFENAIYSVYNRNIDRQIGDIEATIKHYEMRITECEAQIEHLRKEKVDVPAEHLADYVRIYHAVGTPNRLLNNGGEFYTGMIFNTTDEKNRNDDTILDDFPIKISDMEKYKDKNGRLTDEAYTEYIDSQTAKTILTSKHLLNTPIDAIRELALKVQAKDKERMLDEMLEYRKEKFPDRYYEVDKELNLLCEYDRNGICIMDISNPYNEWLDIVYMSDYTNALRFGNMTSDEIMAKLIPLRTFAEKNGIDTKDMPKNEDLAEGLKYLATTKGLNFEKSMGIYRRLMQKVNDFATQTYKNYNEKAWEKVEREEVER